MLLLALFLCCFLSLVGLIQGLTVCAWRIAEPALGLGCFAEFSSYHSLLVSQLRSGVPAQIKAPLCEVLDEEDKEEQSHS